ncbi:MAG TPA: LCP family protein [Nocardioidaceae bacterium]|nr:LCP family protein [Nocardioidaceae bacterium]
MDEQGAGPKHALPKPHRARKIFKRLGIGLLVILLGLGTAGYIYYRHLEGNIQVIDPDLGDNRPDAGPKGPLNILLLGSDERVSGGGVLGASDDLSDTTILLHLSEDRTRAYAVSITRDLLIDRPECPGLEAGDPDIPAATGVQINSAFAVGGVNCTWRTVEALTKIRIDDVVVVKFDGFMRMVDALGGVPVCVPKEIDDPDKGIYIPEGTYDIRGDQALDYVRARYGIGDGTDIGRLKRQQAFLASMTNRAISAGTLLNPLKLLPFLEAVTESIEASPGLAKLSKLRHLASQLQDIGLSNVKFLSMPVAIPPEDINRRIPAPESPALWSRIKRDLPLLPSQLVGSIDAGQDPSGQPSETPSGTPSGSPSGSPTATQTPTQTPDDAEAEAAAREAVGLCA